MKRLRYAVIACFIVILVLSCSSLGGSKTEIVGKWHSTTSCWVIYQWRDIEFFKDQTFVVYWYDDDGVGGVQYDGTYTFLDSKRMKISGINPKMYEYSISGDTLTLCEGDSCCEFYRE